MSLENGVAASSVRPTLFRSNGSRIRMTPSSRSSMTESRGPAHDP